MSEVSREREWGRPNEVSYADKIQEWPNVRVMLGYSHCITVFRNNSQPKGHREAIMRKELK